SNQATINLLNNQYLSITGAIDNQGSINLLSVGNDTRLVVDAPGATLTGGGIVALSDYANNKIVGDPTIATLTNVDNVIEGAGQLGFGQLTLVNQAGGMVRANAGNALVIDTASETTVNSGLFEATGAGGLIILDTTVDGSTGGVIQANGGNVGLQS